MEVARMGILRDGVMPPVKKDILAETAPEFVHLTVNFTNVDTQTDRVLPVLQVGRVIIVQLNACGHMEKIVSIDAMFTVSTRPVTDSTAVVCMAVKMDTSVMKFPLTLKKRQNYPCLLLTTYR